MTGQSPKPYRPERYWLATDTEVAQVASHLGISLASDDSGELTENYSRIFFFNSGSDGKRVLKIRARWMTERRVRFEHALAKHLHGCGLPMVLPLEIENGSTWARVENFYCELAQYVDGRETDIDLPDVTRMGELLAQFHEHSSGFAPELYEPPHFQNQTEPQYLEPSFRDFCRRASEENAGDEVFHLDSHKVSELCERWGKLSCLYQRFYNVLPRVLGHGDFHPWNLLFSRTGDDVVALFDLDMAAIGPRIYDISYAIYHHPPDEAEWDTRYRTFITAYDQTSNSPLREEEVAVIPLLLECIDFGYLVRANAQEAPKKYKNYIETCNWLLNRKF